MIMRYQGGGVGHLGMRYDPSIYEGGRPINDSSDDEDTPAPEPQTGADEDTDSDSSKSDAEDFIHEQRGDSGEELEEDDEDKGEGKESKGEEGPNTTNDGEEDIGGVDDEDDPGVYGFAEA
jgi:hypothetical protein